MRLLGFIFVLLAGVTISIAQDGSAPFAAFDKASEEILNDPHDLAVGPDGRLYVADKFGHRITVHNAKTLALEEVLLDGTLFGVHDIDFGKDGRVAIAITGLNVVAVFDSVAAMRGEPSQVLHAPRTEGAMIHSNGMVYALASGIGTLFAFRDGKPVFLVQGLIGAHDVAEDLDGNVWVADNMKQRLVKYSPELDELQVVDHPKYGFIGPRYLDVDDFGQLVVADQDAHRILLIDPKAEDGGKLLGVLGNGVPTKGPNRFNNPEGAAVHGNVYYFSDSDNNRIVRYTIATN